MAILDSSDFTDGTGWTDTTTNGTVTYNNDDGDGRIYVACDNAVGAFNTNGIARTSSQVVALGQVVYWRRRTNTLTGSGSIAGVQTTTTMSSANNYQGGIYNVNSGPWFGADAGVRTADNNPAYSVDTWYDMKCVMEAAGVVNTYVRLTDGTPMDQASGWTSIYASAFTTWTGDSFHFVVNNAAQETDIADWYYTDDGIFTPSASGNVGSSSYQNIRRRRKNNFKK